LKLNKVSTLKKKTLEKRGKKEKKKKKTLVFLSNFVCLKPRSNFL